VFGLVRGVARLGRDRHKRLERLVRGVFTGANVAGERLVFGQGALVLEPGRRFGIFAPPGPAAKWAQAWHGAISTIDNNRSRASPRGTHPANCTSKCNS